MSATAISADTLDLLVTAALRYGVIASRARVAFNPAPAGVLQATPDEAGRILLQHHRTAQHPDPSSNPTPLPSELACYDHVPVTHLDPVHVLKAIHTYEEVAATGAGWEASAARTLTTALLHAAVQALPGYATAPRIWRRPPVRGGSPIGLARQWQPVGEGVTWTTPRELVAHWQSAAIVLLTVDALPDLPPDLPAREGVYVLAHGEVSPADWDAIAQSPALFIVQLPTGGTWLRDELATAAAGLRPSSREPK